MTEDFQDEKLRRALDALPRETAPEHDLWPGIASRITPRRHTLRYGLAAAAVVLVAVGAIVTTVMLERPASLNNTVVTTPATQHPASTPMPSTPRAAKLAATVRRATHRDPRMQAVLLHNLALIEQSLADIRRALQESPNDAGLQTLLFQMYASEAALLVAAQRIELQSTLGVAQL